MNTRPTRAPAPPHAETINNDIQFETARPNNLPAERAAVPPPQPELPIAPSTLPATGFGQLATAIANVMSDIKPVEKGGWNKFQSYAYARIQDLMGELTPLMGRHGIVIFQNEIARTMFDGDRAIAISYHFTIAHKSGEVWPEKILQTGLSNCRNTKDGFDDKAINKCHTAARKYFLLSLFQIPTEDIDEADGSGGNGDPRKRPQQQAKRPAPAPDGKMQPHTITIVDGELPQDWAKRFNTFIDKAETTAEIDKWYDANANVFDKIKGRFPDVYDDLIDYMDVRAAKFDGAKEPAKVVAKAPASDFPGDSKQDTGIPTALRRTITDEERDWLMGLEGAFSGCEDEDSLKVEYDRLMEKYQDRVSPAAWDKACAIHDENIERIERDV